MIFVLIVAWEPLILPPETLEVLWETWQNPKPVWVGEATEEDLRAFPLFSEADVRAILRARASGPFRSYDDFFARTGLSPDLLPFLEPWLLLSPRENASFRVTASTLERPRLSGKFWGENGALWSEIRTRDTSWRAVLSTPWFHLGTFRPVSGWTGPFPRSLWSSLTLPDEEEERTRLDTVFRVWLHPRVKAWSFHLLWPDSLAGLRWGEFFHLWFSASEPGIWLGFRTDLWGVEIAPESTRSWAISGFFPGEHLRWAWRVSPGSGTGEARASFRFSTWGLNVRWLSTEEGVSLRASGYLRSGDTRLYAGAWEDGFWMRLDHSPWSWKWGKGDAHRVEIRYARRWGFFRGGVVSAPTTLWWMHSPFPVSSGYGETGLSLAFGGWKTTVRVLAAAGDPPRMAAGGELRWKGHVSW